MGGRRGGRSRERKDGWTWRTRWIRRSPVVAPSSPSPFALLRLIDSGSRLTRGWSLNVLSRSPPAVFFSTYERDGTKIHGRRPVNRPQGGGSFHVGGSRVPGSNTFLIEMLIERQRGISVGERGADGSLINCTIEPSRRKEPESSGPFRS